MKKYQKAPIRKGCYVEFVNILSGGYQRLCSGYVIEHNYDENGWHFFTIQHPSGDRSVTVSGVHLYKNLLEHIPGEQSKIDERRAKKRNKKEVKAYHRAKNRVHRKRKRKSFSRQEIANALY